MKAVLITGHFYEQKRRGSMHWLADEFLKHGWEVTFVTVGYSWLSRVLGDVRLSALDQPPRPGLSEVKPALSTYFQYTPLHPIDLRRPFLNTLATPMLRTFPLFWKARLKILARDADIVVVESGPGLLLAPELRRRTSAKLVYRVNDDLRAMRSAPILREAETKFAHLFDRVSLASPLLARRFDGLAPVGLDPMGLDTSLFDKPNPTPYADRWGREVVCAGTSHFDPDAVLTMAQLRPNWRFHILGRLRDRVDAPNIVAHGELPFAAVVPYVQHADIAIAPYRDVPGMEYQAHHSNRLLQYAYTRLPTLAPVRMTHPELSFLVGYQPGNSESLERALETAEAFDRKSIRTRPPTWTALYEGVIKVLRGTDDETAAPTRAS
jgi:2-beta-glucuronyltransferase